MKTLPSSLPLKSTLLSFLHNPPNTTTTKSFNQIHALILTSRTDLSDRLPSPRLAYLTIKHAHHHHNHHPTPFLFNSLISAYASTKSPQSALTVYKLMSRDRIPLDKYTFPIILKSCAKFSGTIESRQFHNVVVKLGFSSDLFVQNALVYAYSVCGDCVLAHRLFDDMPVKDVVSWTGLISGLVKAGFLDRALRLFGLMDVEPNGATLVSVLGACGRRGDLAMGRRIHGLLIRRGLERGSVAGNAVMDMYVKCERLDEARRVFDELPCRDVVSWTSIICGLAQCKRPKDALEVFSDMQAAGVEPDKVVLSSVLSACASLGALDSGRWIHEYLDRKGVEWDCHIGTALVDMYAKSGCLETAVHTFDKMPHKNVSSWNALLGGLAMHGHGKDALDYFNRMLTVGVTPNEVTFIAILSACSHCGLVEQGRHHFYSMTKFYNLTPTIEHYGCMVDLFCRAEILTEAYELIRTMPMRADVLIWGALLSACRACGNAELSNQIMGHLLEIETSESGVYVLLSNIFAITNRWTDVTRLRRLMREKGINKDPGSSVIEVNGKACEFLAGDSGHPHKEEIWMVLSILAKQMQLDWF